MSVKAMKSALNGCGLCSGRVVVFARLMHDGDWQPNLPVVPWQTKPVLVRQERHLDGKGTFVRLLKSCV